MAKDIKKHPKALPVCFMTEMWERFGYKILLGLLVFVLLNQYGLNDARAAEIAGGFTGLLYITSILAGYISDNLIGYYRSILFGGIVLLVGYITLAVSPNLYILCCGLGIISVGTGLLKSNTSSYLGTFYEGHDSKRDKGFTIFYSGINIGSMLGNIVSGFLYKQYGSNVSFYIAAAGIFLGVLVFYLGFKRIKLHLVKSKVKIWEWTVAIVMTIASMILAALIIYYPSLSLIFFIAVVIISVFLILNGSKGSARQFKRSIAYLLFLIIAVFFWGIYNQMFLSMNFFIDRLVVHSFLGIPMTTQSFIVANNVGIIFLGFLVLEFWTFLSDVKKYIIGMALLCFVFVIVIIGIRVTPSACKINAFWVILSYLVLSLSELCISPIGLSLATKLAPKDKVGTFMGLWLVTSGLGGFVAGFIAKYAAIPKTIQSVEKIKDIYVNAFKGYTEIAIAAFVLTIIIGVIINKLLFKDERINTLDKYEKIHLEEV